MSSYKHLRRSWLGILFAILIVAMALNVKPLLKLIYPIRYENTIEYNAEKENLDPFLVAAVIRIESDFRPTALSPKGAVGLMQLMPETGKWAADQVGLGQVETAELFRPEINIQLGTWYLSSLLKMFESDLSLALAAYNAGLTNVKRWVSEEIWLGDEDDLGKVPFPETRKFIQRVQRVYRIHKFAYQEW